jgi:hypothetical protein
MNAPMLPLTGERPPLVVGGDLSLTASGLAWPDGFTMKYGVKGLTDKTPDLADRGAALKTLVVNIVNRMMERGRPDLVLLEILPSSGTHIDGERFYVWYGVVNALTGLGVPVTDASVSTIKKYALGKGSGPDTGKGAVTDALARRLPHFETAGDENRADAAWMCALGMDLLGHPLAAMPQANREALSKVKVPAPLATLAVAR